MGGAVRSDHRRSDLLSPDTIKVCKRGHEFRGDENYRARNGWCPVCFREVQARYERSEKGKARLRRYSHSEKGIAREMRYRQSPKGWLNDLRLRRSKALKSRANRVND